MEYRAAVTRLYDDLNRGDVEAAYRDFADDCLLTSPAGAIQGRQAMIESDRQIFGQLSAHSRKLEHVLVDGSDVATWITWSGTVDATGKSFECPVCNVFHFDGERIAKWESYGEYAAAFAAFQP